MRNCDTQNTNLNIILQLNVNCGSSELKADNCSINYAAVPQILQLQVKGHY